MPSSIHIPGSRTGDNGYWITIQQIVGTAGDNLDVVGARERPFSEFER